MLELYHFGPVANSFKPLMCLAEKSLAFVSHQLDGLRFEQYSPQFLALNPAGQVPVLVHDGRVITESTVINEYLDEVFPHPPLRPAEAYSRARMRIWTKWVDEYVCPALTILGSHAARHRARGVPHEEFRRVLARIPLEEVRRKWVTVAGASYSEAELQEARRRLGVCARRLDAGLADACWLVGEEYSLADVDAFSMAIALPKYVPEAANPALTPHLMRWHRQMSARPQLAELLRIYANRQSAPWERQRADSAGKDP